MMKTNTIKPGHTCPWWLLFTFDNPLRKWIHNPKAILGSYVQPGDTVLDVGCGMGYFTLGLAELVGPEGKVIAADLQAQMLNGLRRRAEHAALLQRIQLQQSTPDRLGVQEPVDFTLAFWMVHEVRDQAVLLGEVYNILNPGGKLLIAEPKIHVVGKAFQRTVALAESIGFRAIKQPKVRGSRAILLKK